MEKKNALEGMATIIDGDTYEGLYEIAKRQKKSVAEVTSDALRKHIESNQIVSESKERKILTD